MYCATACPLFVVIMLINARLYGLSHVCVDRPLVMLLEYLKPKLLLWSWLFPFGRFSLHGFQRSKYVSFPCLLFFVTVLCFSRLYTCCLNRFLMTGDYWFVCGSGRSSVPV